MPGVISVPDEFVSICEQWHNGQSSPMYGVLSTGKISVRRLYFLRAEIQENLDCEMMGVFPGEYRALEAFLQWVNWIDNGSEDV